MCSCVQKSIAEIKPLAWANIVSHTVQVLAELRVLIPLFMSAVAIVPPVDTRFPTAKEFVLCYK